MFMTTAAVAGPSRRENSSWQLDQEELELEQQLFGARRKRKLAQGEKRTNGHGEPTGLALVADEAVSVALSPTADEADDYQLFSVDAPTAVSDDEDIDDEAETSLAAMSDASDSESDAAVDEEDLDDGVLDADQKNTEDGDSDTDANSEVDIIVPENQYDLDPEAEEQARLATQKRLKPAAWHDPSDDLIGVDLDEIKRLKKLARGKKTSKVRGSELERRLRDQ